MRVLFISSLCSTPAMPRRSPGNARILRAVRALAPCRMIIPLRYYPPGFGRLRPALREQIDAPSVETDSDGTEILHPRVAHLPGVARSLHGALYAASLYPLVRAEVARFKPDVVLSAFAYPDGFAAVALARRFNLPSVVRTMGGDIHRAAQSAGRRGQIAWSLKRAGRTIAVSPAMGPEIEALGVPARQIAIIPTGVDRAVFHPLPRGEARAALGLPADGPVVMAPARLSAEKGLAFLLDALPAVKGATAPRLLLVGDGPERAALTAQAARLGIADRVQFEGFQPEARMKVYYSAADLSCLPSLEEGWPDALMESFACGCPAVVSKVGGMPDMVALTGAGLLAPPGDAAGLAAALSEGLGRGWPREETVRTMEKYTLSRTAERYLEACADAVREHRA